MLIRFSPNHITHVDLCNGYWCQRDKNYWSIFSEFWYNSLQRNQQWFSMLKRNTFSLTCFISILWNVSNKDGASGILKFNIQIFNWRKIQVNYSQMWLVQYYWTGLFFSKDVMILDAVTCVHSDKLLETWNIYIRMMLSMRNHWMLKSISFIQHFYRYSSNYRKRFKLLKW